jgi:integrase
MGAKNISGVRKVVRGGKPRLILDFMYTDKEGVRRRFRRTATVQLQAAALAEAKRLMAHAAETGVVEDASVPDEAAKLKVTFKTFVEGDFDRLYMPSFRDGTQVRYRALLRQGLLEFFGASALEDIGTNEIQAFGASLQKRRIQLKGPVNLLRTILRSAVASKILACMPIFPKLWKASKKLPDAPSDEEVEAMIRFAVGWLRIAILLAAYGGLRQGEVRAVEVGDVDLQGGRLLIRRALSENTPVTPKSGNDRAVPLAPELKSALEPALRSKLPRARVVTTDDGRTPTRQGFLTAFKAFLRKHGLKDRSFHSLRHYFCSTLIRRGASVEAVRLLAGHSDLQVTQRYVHAAAGDLQAAIATLSTRKA